MKQYNKHEKLIREKPYSTLLESMRSILSKKGYLDLALLKESFPLSRKYLTAYLDYLDRFEDIQSDGVKRYLRHKGSK